MVFMIVCAIIVLSLAGYYLYRQATDPGPSIFPYNDVLAKKRHDQPSTGPKQG